MSVKLRQYQIKRDFAAAGAFLAENYLPGNRNGNFFPPAWEYMHYHPMLDEKLLDNIGVWEDKGRIVGFVHPEIHAGEAFFEISPRYAYLKPQMLDYAESRLGGKAPDGRMCLLAFVNDFDKDFESLVSSRGFEMFPELARPMTALPVPYPFPPILLPDGFVLKSLAEENDLAKLDCCVWRGFNHGDEPPLIDYAGRKKMQSAPGFRKDLNNIVIAPDGNYVAYAGLWYEPENKFAYVEPVCTDPAYRRQGLGTAAVMAGIRRCGELGAKVAYVGSVQPFYQSMGFKKLFTCNCWRKYLDGERGS
jgi:GNAT superfamily N-acetyltransferase